MNRLLNEVRTYPFRSPGLSSALGIVADDIQNAVDRARSRTEARHRDEIARLMAERDKLYASGQWLVVRKRDAEPWEAFAFDRYDRAAMFFDTHAANWSTVYFCRVAHCEGFPLDVTPLIDSFSKRMAAAEADRLALRARVDALEAALAFHRTIPPLKP